MWRKRDGGSRLYRNKAAVNAPNTVTKEAATPAADPVNTGGLEVTVAVAFDGAVPGTSAKLAQVILVVFPKCTTKERLPKKAPVPGTREA